MLSIKRLNTRVVGVCCAVLGGIVSVTLTGPGAKPKAVFRGLGDLPGGKFFSEARAVSADGSVVVGSGTSARGMEPIRWTAATGMRRLGGWTGTLPDGHTHSWARGVSADGSVIVGTTNSKRRRYEAFRWTEKGGVRGLGRLLRATKSRGCTDSFARGVSADGSVVVGYADGPGGSQPFRWSSRDGMQPLRGYRLDGLLGGGNGWERSAWAISADGKVVVGSRPVVERQRRRRGENRAFRWTARTGMQGLGSQKEGGPDSCATAVSPDGSAVVGWIGDVPFSSCAFRWTRKGGMKVLLPPAKKPGYRLLSPSTYAMGVTGNGAVVVGYCEDFDGPFIWDEAHGMRNLEAVLRDQYGLYLKGWRLGIANAISADGRTIVGYGYHSVGKRKATTEREREAWMVVLPKPLRLKRTEKSTLPRPAVRTPTPPRGTPRSPTTSPASAPTPPGDIDGFITYPAPIVDQLGLVKESTIMLTGTVRGAKQLRLVPTLSEDKFQRILLQTNASGATVNFIYQSPSGDKITVAMLQLKADGLFWTWKAFSPTGTGDALVGLRKFVQGSIVKLSRGGQTVATFRFRRSAVSAGKG